MATKTLIDEIEIPDHEDGGVLRVQVSACDELGNRAVPGLQVFYLGQYANYEPHTAERLAYQMRKEGKTEMLLPDSWNVHENTYIRNYLVLPAAEGQKPKARVEVKTRSSKPMVREYELPFDLEA